MTEAGAPKVLAERPDACAKECEPAAGPLSDA